MAKWLGLKKGDLIDLIAPASSCDLELLKKGIQVIESWGLKVRMTQNMISTHPYLADTDEARFEYLKQALLNPESKAVWAVRGGYGCSRLLSRLAKVQPKTKKLLIGYSDITWLHHWLSEQWKWQGLHAPLVAELGSQKLSKKTLRETKKFLLNPGGDISFKGLKLLHKSRKGPQIIKAPIVGGNLAVLQTTLGGAYAFSGKGKIIFFEDVGERGYSIDRILNHMSQAGVFKGAKAVIFGEFLGGDEVSGKNYVQSAFLDFASQSSFPVLKGLKVGHGRHNQPIYLSAPSQLALGKSNTLKIGLSS